MGSRRVTGDKAGADAAGKGSLRKAEIDTIEPLGPANAYGHMISVAVLEDEKVGEFVWDVRKRRGINPPTSRVQAKQNLKLFRWQDFVAEARPVAREFWERTVGQDPDFLWRQRLVRSIGWVSQKVLRVDYRGLDVWHILGVEGWIETSARVIAKFIVVDVMQVAEPVNVPMSGRARIQVGDKAPLSYAYALPGSEPEDLSLEVKRQQAEREAESGWKLPTQAKETVWMRFCDRTWGKRGRTSTTTDGCIKRWTNRTPAEVHGAPDRQDRIRQAHASRPLPLHPPQRVPQRLHVAIQPLQITVRRTQAPVSERHLQHLLGDLAVDRPRHEAVTKA